MEPIVTAVLSYGMSGRLFHAPFVALHPGFKFYAVVERHEKKINRVYPDVISYANTGELLADDHIELVIVNTPSDTHYELAKKALLAGKHVLVEKPFAASSAEAADLFETAKKAGKYILAYQNRRWDSDFLSVKQVIDSGRLGRLIEVNFRFDRYKKELGPKKFQEDPVPGSGIIYNLGPHLIDGVISLFGEPLSYTRSAGMFRPGSVVSDYVSWRLLYSGNMHVNITAGLLIAAPVPSFIVHGENGSYLKARTDVQEIQLDRGVKPNDPIYGLEPANAEGELTLINKSGQKEKTLLSAPAGNYLPLFEAIYAQIRNGVPYPITEAHIMWQMRLLEG